MLNPVDDRTREAMVRYRIESNRRDLLTPSVIAQVELVQRSGSRYGVVRQAIGVRLIQVGAWLSGADVRLETGNQGC